VKRLVEQGTLPYRIGSRRLRALLAVNPLRLWLAAVATQIGELFAALVTRTDS
jgi:hypothetical protein